MTDYQLIVVGGGPAGLAAAIAAWEEGLTKILVVERDRDLGGILNQCIHNGFGLHHFGEELTGPEYAGRFVQKLAETGVSVLTDAMVLEVTPEKQVRLVSREMGYQELTAQAVVLAMGCRERTRGAIGTPGTRPAGVFTAGAAQRYVNIEGQMPGKRVVILGSGDIGLIMARRMTLEGAKVLACVELMPYSGGLTRNIVQCLQDYDIPLYLSHTITEIRGKNRLSGVTVAQVGPDRAPIPGTEQDFACDTLLLSVGLVPENELTRAAGIPIDPHTNGAVVYENRETECPGIFACGNVLQVHDLVDYVTAESELAGRAAAAYLAGGCPADDEPYIAVDAGAAIGYTVPQRIRPGKIDKSAELFFRVRAPMKKSRILVTSGGVQLAAYPRERLAPGEMERIQLPKSLLQKAMGSITVSAEEVAE
ncbi:MAG: FAD-dependent oxidoreductase [Gemmiger sp.]|nr:FAD-dependent oxidoreductase [Gemmiger sp.]